MGAVVVNNKTKCIAFLLYLFLPTHVLQSMYPILKPVPDAPKKQTTNVPTSPPLEPSVTQRSPNIQPILTSPVQGRMQPQRRIIPESVRQLEKTKQLVPQVPIEQPKFLSSQPKTYLELFEALKTNSPAPPSTLITPQAFNTCIQDAQQNTTLLYFITMNSITSFKDSQKILDLFKKSRNSAHLFTDTNGQQFFQAIEILGGYFCYFNINADEKLEKALLIVLTENEKNNLPNIIFNTFKIPIKPEELTESSLIQIITINKFYGFYELIIKEMNTVQKNKRKKAEKEQLAQKKAAQEEQKKLVEEKEKAEAQAKAKQIGQQPQEKEKVAAEVKAQEVAEQQPLAEEKAPTGTTLPEQEAGQQAEKERVAEEERLAREKAGKEAEEQKLAQAKAAEEEQERLRKAEEERLAQEKAAQEELQRLAEEKEKAEAESRVQAEQTEKQRLANEEEQKRVEAERLETERLEQEQKAQLLAKEAESIQLAEAIKLAAEKAAQELKEIENQKQREQEEAKRQEDMRAQELMVAKTEEERAAAEQEEIEKINAIIARINTIDDLITELQTSPLYPIPAEAFNKVIADTKREGYRIVFMTDNVIKSLWGTSIELVLYPLLSEDKEPTTLQDITNHNNKILLRYVKIPGGALFLKPQSSGNFDPLILTDPKTDAAAAYTTFNIPFSVQIQATADSTFFANFFDTVLAKLKAETASQEMAYKEATEKKAAYEAEKEKRALEEQEKAIELTKTKEEMEKEAAETKEAKIKKEYEKRTTELHEAQREREAEAEKAIQLQEAQKIKEIMEEERAIERKSFQTRHEEEARAKAFEEAKKASAKRAAAEEEITQQILTAQALAEQEAAQKKSAQEKAEQEQITQQKIIETVKTVPDLITQLQTESSAPIPQQALQAIVKSAQAEGKRMIFMNNAIVDQLKNSPVAKLLQLQNPPTTLHDIKDNESIILQYAKIPQGALFLQPTKGNFDPLIITAPQTSIVDISAQFNTQEPLQVQSSDDPSFLETFFAPLLYKLKTEKEAEEFAAQQKEELIAAQQKAETAKLAQEKELAEQQEIAAAEEKAAAQEKAEEEVFAMLQKSVQETAAKEKEKIIETVKTVPDLITQLQTESSAPIPQQALQAIVKSAQAEGKRILFIAQDILESLKNNPALQTLLHELFVKNNEKMPLQPIKDTSGNVIMQYAKIPSGAIFLIQQEFSDNFLPLILTKPNTDPAAIAAQFPLSGNVQIQSPHDANFLKKLFALPSQTISHYAKLGAEELARSQIKHEYMPEEELARQQLRTTEPLPEWVIGRRLPTTEELEQKPSATASQTARNQAEKVAQQLEKATKRRTARTREEEKTTKPEREFDIEVPSYTPPTSAIEAQSPRGTAKTASAAVSGVSYSPRTGGYAAAATPSYTYTSPAAKAYGDYAGYTPSYRETGAEAEYIPSGTSYYSPSYEGSTYTEPYTYEYEYEEPQEEEIITEAEKPSAQIKPTLLPKTKVPKKRSTKRAARRLAREAIATEQPEKQSVTKPEEPAKIVPEPSAIAPTKIEPPKTTFEVYYRQAIAWTIDKVTNIVNYFKNLFGLS